MDGILSAPSVRIRDPADVETKLKTLISGGLDKLQVIADFDYTVSRYCDEKGEKCWTTHGIFDAEAARIDSQLGEKLNALKQKYLAIEFDPELSIEEKIPHMLDWWQEAHIDICAAKFSRPILESFVRDANVRLRDNCDQMFTLLEGKGVPLILFSAGIGDMIEMFLKQRLGAVPKNLHLISNMMVFDENDCAVDFSKPLIHTFNKNSSVVSQERTFFHDIRNRPNVLLLGDSLGDLHMDVGVENEGAVLKIGFLNFNVDKLLPKYLDGYDVVLVQDQSMNVPMSLLNAMQNK